MKSFKTITLEAFVFFVSSGAEPIARCLASISWCPGCRISPFPSHPLVADFSKGFQFGFAASWPTAGSEDLSYSDQLVNQLVG